MRAFQEVAGGYTARLDAEERVILARLTLDVLLLISDDESATIPPEPPAAPRPDSIEHLDFSLASAVGTDVEEEYLALDPALARMFPPMSLEDPHLAGELRSLTLDGLRQGKVRNLGALARGLKDCQVFILEAEVGTWLAALTDIRLVLASRLGIESDEDADQVQDAAIAARRVTGPAATPEKELELALSSLYLALTWWQESLLSAMLGSGRDNYA